MIWYLLYPFRGTTEAPLLGPAHPLRGAFTRYGRYAARHVLATLLISSAVAAILIYPFPFLYTTDFSNGASNLPHQVWTDAQPLQDQSRTEADVVMHSIWIHGSYMKALDKDVLLGALELQDDLLGPTRNFDPRQPTNSIPLPDPTGDLLPQDRDKFHVFNGITNQSWFFHSPLQYWSCSLESILADTDIIATVNEKKTQPTSANITLRPSTVFSGKRFENRRLVAADALVITLLHLRDSPVAKQWVRKARALAARVADRWDIFPADGHSMTSQLYEFQFRPMSLQDSMLLALAYSLTVFYFMVSLSRLRAVKSKDGLIVTVLTQIAISILSSFTVCAIFEIDLSRIPRAAYPLAVLAMSLENMFRLINAVIMTPPEDSSSNRIGVAFGQTAHVAVASVVQNLLILWGLSKVMSSGVSAFCTFAAIAIVFDFFYLSTFFLSVLSVDVRRLELSDALEKVSFKPDQSGLDRRVRKPWSEAVLEGKIALSTRIAGTVVMLGFVFIAQWHFFEKETVFRTAMRLFSLLRGNGGAEPPPSTLLVDIHQARSPTSWLRLQDHETAREVIHVIKPDAHSYIAHVYEPLVFVLKGADRMPSGQQRKLLPAAYDFVHHQMFHFVVTVFVVVAAVRLLMNYLLWDEVAQSDEGGNDADEEPPIAVKTLDRGHILDVALLAASSDGHVVSVGLDRLIRVWDVRLGNQSYIVPDPDDPAENLFPVLGMTVDEDAEWLVLLSSRKVFWWHLTDRRWGASMAVDLCGHKPEAFFFGPRKTKANQSVILVRRNGTMVELWPDLQKSTETLLCKTPLICAVSFAETRPSTSSTESLAIMTLSRRGCIHHVTQVDENWVSKEVEIAESDGGDLHSIIPLPALSSYLLVRPRTVDLVVLRSGKIAHTFETEPSLAKTMRIVQLRRRQSQKGSQGLSSLTMIYANAENGSCVLQTYLPPLEGQTICLYDPSGPSGNTCCRWKDTREIKRSVEDPGVWEALTNGCVVGVRKRPLVRTGTADHRPAAKTGRLRRRGHKAIEKPTQARDEWEVWLMSQLERIGDIETTPLSKAEEMDQQLIISELGPMAKAGMASLAVGFGNVIKLITAGHERFESSTERRADETLANLGGRRRRPGGAARNRTVSGANKDI